MSKYKLIRSAVAEEDTLKFNIIVITGHAIKSCSNR